MDRNLHTRIINRCQNWKIYCILKNERFQIDWIIRTSNQE
jgi:hypothetical protein